MQKKKKKKKEIVKFCPSSQRRLPLKNEEKEKRSASTPCVKNRLYRRGRSLTSTYITGHHALIDRRISQWTSGLFIFHMYACRKKITRDPTLQIELKKRGGKKKKKKGKQQIRSLSIYYRKKIDLSGFKQLLYKY